MLLVDRDPKALTPDPHNPRRISRAEAAKLVASIRAWVILEPLVYNTRLGCLVGGHQRRAAAIEVGLETVPVYEIELDETAHKQANIALNRIRGEFDELALATILEDLRQSEAEITLTGFDHGEIDALLASLGESTLQPVREPGEGQRVGLRQEPVLKAVLLVRDLAVCEQALAAAGERERGAAFVKVCQHYLDTAPIG